MLKRSPIADRGISVVIPAYNEGSSLTDVVAGIAGVMEQMNRGHEIIVIDDGSTDETGVIASGIVSKNRHVRVVSHPAHQGYGACLRDGIKVAKYPLLLQLDPGNQYDPQQLDRLLRAIDEV